MISAILLLSVMTPAKEVMAQPSGVPAPVFMAGTPEPVATQGELNRKGVRGIDTAVYALVQGDSRKWFCSTGNKEFVTSEGPLDDPWRTVHVARGQIRGLEKIDAEGCLQMSWIANVYQPEGQDEILAFVHVEAKPEQKAGVYFRMGLAISRDGGLTFDWCGEILRPRLRYATWFRHWQPERFRAGFVYPNIGLANYILKDGFFYLYYTDTEEDPDELRHGMAVARARVDEVVKAALEGKASPWHKYHQGQWREPGLGGAYTALNLDPIGFLHGDAAYNEALDGYLLVTRKYFYTDRNDVVIDHAYEQAETGAILLSFSRDGLTWSDWQVVHEDNHCHDYPSIVSEGPDNEVTGERFWILFKKFHSKLPRRGWNSQAWYRVPVSVK